jgi:hypothetical protein
MTDDGAGQTFIFVRTEPNMNPAVHAICYRVGNDFVQKAARIGPGKSESRVETWA